MKSKTRLSAVRSALIAGAFIAVHGNAVAEPKRSDSLQNGERMIARCLDYAASQQFPPLSIGVIDASATLVSFKRQAGASAATAEAALLKARTALRVDAPTAVLGPAVASDASTRDAFLILQLTTLPGGVPLPARDGLATGAVGVSGGSAEQDAECARRAAESLPIDAK